MYCSRCGKELFDQAVICPHCGCGTINLKKMMTQTTPAPVPVTPTVTSSAPAARTKTAVKVADFTNACRINLILSYISLGACMTQFLLGFILLFSEEAGLSIFLAHFSLAELIFSFILSANNKELHTRIKPSNLTPELAGTWQQARTMQLRGRRAVIATLIINFVFWVLFFLPLLMGWSAFFQQLIGETPEFDLGEFFKDY